MSMPRLGAHMSIQGGPANAITRGYSAGCDTIQMFTRSSNRWISRDLTEEEIAAFWQARQDTGISPIVAHSSYLINLATPDEALWARSVDALVIELERCRQLGITSYVLHPGAHTGAGEEEGLAQAARGLDAALDRVGPSNVMVVLEITAGQGSSLGYKFEHLAWIIAHAEHDDRLGVCVDTAHALAAGYDFRTPAAYEAMWQQFDATIGMERLRVLHLNDSKRDLGSRVDRHEHIGEGFVTLEAFRMLVNDPRLRRVPMLLETPKGPDMAEDMRNLTLLRSLVEAD